MRIFFDSILVLSVLILPFPATLFLMCVGFFLYPHYGEAVALAIGVEVLYRGEGAALWIGQLPLAALVLVLLIVVEVLRSFIRDRTT